MIRWENQKYGEKREDCIGVRVVRERTEISGKEINEIALLDT